MQNADLRMSIDAAPGNRKLEQLPVPFAAIATDVATGERVILRRGPAGLGIGASCSVPVFFEPVNIEGRDLVDGGLTEPVPAIAVREMGAEFANGVDVAFRPHEEKFQALTGVAFQTMHIMVNALIKEQLPRADIAIRMNLHGMIGKVVRRSKKYHAHSPNNEFKHGDTVMIEETRPLSKTKAWQVTKLLEKARVE